MRSELVKSALKGVISLHGNPYNITVYKTLAIYWEQVSAGCIAVDQSGII